MSQMKAVRPTEPNMGDPAAAAKVAIVPIPEPQAGEYQVKLLLRPVNPADLFSLMGVYPGCKAPAHWPITVGLDGMGVVTKAGSGASKFPVGQRVAVAGFPTGDGNGTWAEYAAFKEADLVAVPDAVSDEEAAQFWVNPVTVYGMLETVAVPKGGYLVLSAAGSALCRMTTQLANSRGIKVIGIVRRAAQVQEVLSLGADACFSTEGGEDVAAAIKAHTGGVGADAALDSVGGDTTNVLTNALKPGGTVVIYGAMSGMSATVSIVPVLFMDVHVRGFWLNTYINAMSREQRDATAAAVMRLLADKTISSAGSFVGQKFPLDGAADAVRASAAPGRGGKVFIDSR